MLENNNSNNSNPFLRDLIAGSVAGMVGKVVEFPMDTVKVRLQALSQSSQSGAVQFRGPLDCVIKTVKNEGFFAFYQGLLVPLFGAALESAVLFAAYQRAAEWITDGKGRDELNLKQSFLCGLFAGMGTAFVLTPVELIKCRLQVQQKGTVLYRGPLDCIQQTVRADGISGLYRGFGSTLLREVPANGAWFCVYEAVSRWVSGADCSSKAPGYVQMFAGACAGCAYWLLPYPIDTIKSELQTQKKSSSFLSVGQSILRQYGIRGLYRGVSVTMIRAMPGNATIFFVYEKVSKLLQNASSSSTDV